MILHSAIINSAISTSAILKSAILKYHSYICTMQVDDELVDKLARLSMLQFNDAEKEEIKADLQKMIGFLDKIKELDLDDVEPLLHMSSNQDVLRDDIPGNMVSREDALKNSQGQNEKFFVVPKVITKTGK
jgi:aspartyl-tRNA(Asn)/glutamyl-tRNA(Gln) amidotransferase subunit C